MMYQDNTGEWQIGYEGRKRLKPEDCRPYMVDNNGRRMKDENGEDKKVPHLDRFGQVFPYATRGTCFSPTGGGVRMVPVTAQHVPALPNLSPFSTPAEKQARKQVAKERVSTGHQSSLLGPQQYLEKRFGQFRQIRLTEGEVVGPITDYQGSCLYWTLSGGTGTLHMSSRNNFTDQPVPAVMAGPKVERWGHSGAAWQVFFKATGGNLRLDLERRRGAGSCQ
jgi:hypothetical protein